MVINEKWAISVKEVSTFFQEQKDVNISEDGFRYQDCRITFTGLDELIFGKWKMPKTSIQFEGSEESVNTIYRRFFLRFLSAGG